MAASNSLRITFHGRILDHLGIQMYQSPTAAIAELISNSWDADADAVNVALPADTDDKAQIVISDNGAGMTRQECEDRYLNIGYCRRGNAPSETSRKLSRPILGRKGIGKFAGFGIATMIEVDTISEATGERTVFVLDINALRTSQYVEKEGEVPVTTYEPPSTDRIAKHGTTIYLKGLRLRRKIASTQFAQSMSRRFLLLRWAAGFTVSIDGKPLSDDIGITSPEFDFPKDYPDDQKPNGCVVGQDGWGTELLPDGKEVRWRFVFAKDPIEEEELRGISVFAGIKLAQRPFFFNLTGGLSGQHGLEYLTGRVVADYLDALDHDIIAPERQRINWEDSSAVALEQWGQSRIKELLRIWRDLRGGLRRDQIEKKIAGFSERLNKLPSNERATVKQALSRLGSIPALSDAQFEDVGNAVLTSWEQGRLQALITQLASAVSLDERELLNILAEQEVLTALNVAEAVQTKILAVAGLKDRIDKHDLENAIRDYIAVNPWLIDPQYQTYKKEISLKKLLASFAEQYRLPAGKDGKRVDLCLSSGRHLVVIEFMIPGKPLDIDHLTRYEMYFRAVRTHLKANSGGEYDRATGLIVADSLDTNPVFLDKLESMRREEMLALDWQGLLARALSKWEDLLRALAARTPRDPRMLPLIKDYLS